MLTNTAIVIRDSDGIIKIIAYEEADKNAFFFAVSKHIAFSDCSGEDIMSIYFEGKEIEYAGWQQGMKFEYKDLDGNTVWVGVFEHWDH